MELSEIGSDLADHICVVHDAYIRRIVPTSCTSKMQNTSSKLVGLRSPKPTVNIVVHAK